MFNFTFFSISGWVIDLDYYDVKWFALEMNRDNSVIFEIAFKYCMSDSSAQPSMQKHASCDGPCRRAAERSYPMSKVRGGGCE